MDKVIKRETMEVEHRLNGTMIFRFTYLASGFIVADYTVKSWNNDSYYKYARAKNIKTLKDRIDRDWVRK